MAYIPLHVHSVFSPYEGMITLQELVSRASFLKLPAIALTDHWTTYGHHEFYNLAVSAGIKPVLGVEVQHSSLVGNDGFYHLTLIAENNRGYRNLVSLVNCHYTKGKDFYVTPEELAEYREGLIVLTGCLEGEAGQAVLHGNLGREKQVAEGLLQIFGPENLFLEVMNHNIDKEQLVIDQLAILSRRLDVPLVVTNNDRYIMQEEGDYYEILVSLRARGRDRERDKVSREYYLKRDKDLEPYFYTMSGALDVSGEIAERCNVELKMGGGFSFSSQTNPHDTLVEMCERRFLLKFHNTPPDECAYLKRLMNKELESALREGLSDFLLFLRNLFRTASREGIWLELMGSDLLESFVAYLLEIVPINPVDRGLIFESYSSSRPGIPPAVEIVKSEGTKERLIEIVKVFLPGNPLLFHVSQEEMSFQTIVKEVGELFELTPETHDELIRALAFERRHQTLASMLENSEVLRHLYNGSEVVRKTLHAAHVLHGRIYHFNLNSSRFVILPGWAEEATSYITGSDGERFALIANSSIEAIGGWTMGVQRSHFLSALESAVKEISGRDDRELSLYSFDEKRSGKWAPEALDDPQTLFMIAAGETVGVYLLESAGIRDLLIQIKPSTFDELVNVISLYRPAPLEGRLWQRYIENAEKKGKVYLPHHSLAAILEGTRGLLLYREQVREILSYSAGLEGERAVAVENALKNQDSGELLTARLAYIRGAMDHGIDEEDAQKIFDFLLHNIRFTYNKALSCSQAYLSYRLAYLKAHFPEEYFVSLLNSNLDVRERHKKYLTYLENVNIDILPVDINLSGELYAVEESGIRAPLLLAKSLESGERENILNERAEKGDFTSIKDFLERTSGKVSIKAVFGSVEEGVFDGWRTGRDELTRICKEFFEGDRKIDFFKEAAARAPRTRKKKESGRQLSFFDGDLFD